MVAKYRKQSSSNFDKNVNLHERHYKLAKWVQKVPKDSPYSAIFETARSKQLAPSHGKIVENLLILSYLRNVIEYYSDQVTIFLFNHFQFSIGIIISLY